VYILQSIDQGPFQLGVTRDTLGTTPEGGVLLGPERDRTYDDLNDNEKKRFDADVRATNIVLQGLPKDIYKLINHNIKAKAIWDNVKMLLAGSELTKEDRESQLYDEFERFKMLPGENINEYYVRFHKLVNDMRNIRMTMPNIQLNSKFVNNMSPEWDRFVTAVKLNKGLKETNHEQMYAYLKQHEKHVAQDRMIIERITPPTNDSLAFVSNNQRYFARGNGTAGFRGTQNRAGNANAGQGKPIKCYNCNGIGHIARNCTQPKRPQNSDYFKDKMMLMQAQENRAVLDEEELLFLVGEQPNTFDADNQPVQDLALNEDNIFQADECDAFDSDVDDELTAQSIFMANLSLVGPANPQASPFNASILFEVHILENVIDHSVTNQDEHEIHNEVQQANVIDSTSVDMGNCNVIPYEQYLSVDNIFIIPSCASSTLNDVCVSFDNDAFVPHDPIAIEIKIYKEQVAIYEQRAKFELTEREQRMDDQMRMLIQNRNKTEENLKKELHSVKLQLNSTMENNKIIKETVYDQKTKTALGAQNPFYLRHAKKAQPALYDGEELLKTHHVPVIFPSSKEDLELEETTRNKLHAKMNDSAYVEKMVNITPPNYSKENFMATFTPQTQLTPEQVFWSIDLEKRKAKELKANAPPLPVLPPMTVYPPNTPVHLVPRTLPTTSQVNIGLFSDMHDAFTIAQKRIADLESKNFNLEVEHFNLQLKYQILKEHFGNKKPVTSSDAPSFGSLFVIGKLNEQIQSRGNTICELKEKISRLTKKNSDAYPIFDLKALRLSHFARDCRSPAIPAAPVNAVDARPNQRACYECGDPNHLKNVCPKLNRESGQSGNQLALGWRRNDHGGGNQVRGRAYNASMNAAEAAKDSSVVTGTFSLNDHFATVLFDSGADFSFISTKFAPILNMKPSIANPGYVIEIADGKKVKVDRIIRGCKLELGSSLFTIDLIPLGHGSFDVIVGMDWLSLQH
ncbi:retrovirus-related pol polyprotein from transposon TNT 1-94, partial [Tanacetum coccineum]